VFSSAVAPTERIYSLRSEATDFYRAVHPLLAVVTTVERATQASQLQPYLRTSRCLGLARRCGYGRHVRAGGGRCLGGRLEPMDG